MSRNYFDFCRAVRDLTYEGGERLCTVMMYLSAPSDGGNTGQSHFIPTTQHPPTHPPTFNFHVHRSSTSSMLKVFQVRCIYLTISVFPHVGVAVKPEVNHFSIEKVDLS